MPSDFSNPQVWFAQGEAERDAGNFRQAELLFEKAAELDPCNGAYLTEWGLALYENGKTDEALSVLRRATTAAPQIDSVWCARGVVLFKAGETDTALVCFERAARINPHEAQNWVNLGLVYASIQKYTKALSAFEQAIEIQPEDADIWMKKARVLAELGETERANHCAASSERLKSIFQ